jgi:hypothetical protein
VICDQANAEESHLFYNVPPTAEEPLSLYSDEQNTEHRLICNVASSYSGWQTVLIVI